MRRPSFVVLGLFLVTVSALGGASLVQRSSPTVQALIVAGDVDRGQVLSAADLRVVDIVPSRGLAWMAPADQDRIVGSTARGPLTAGLLVSPGLFGSSSGAIGKDRVVVSAALRPGAMPSSAGPGDLVRLHVTSPTSTVTYDPASAALHQPDGQAVVPATLSLGEAMVWSVISIGGFGETVVELLVAEESEPAVTQGAAGGTLKVNLVGGG